MTIKIKNYEVIQAIWGLIKFNLFKNFTNTCRYHSINVSYTLYDFQFPNERPQRMSRWSEQHNVSNRFKKRDIRTLQNRRVLSTTTEAPTLLFRNLWHYKIICIRIIDEPFRPGKLHFVPLRVNSVSLQRRILCTYFVCAFRDSCVYESNLNHRMWSIYLGYQRNLIWFLFRSLNKMCFYFSFTDMWSLLIRT